MVYDYFDSWADTVAAAGFDPTLRRGLSREEVLDSVREVAEDFGRPHKMEEFDEQGITGPHAAKDR